MSDNTEIRRRGKGYGYLGEASCANAERNILIVDDNKLNRAILGKILRSEGYQTIEADNGQSALELLSDSGQAIALVLLDLVMPVMDGYTLLKKMNETGIITSVPVIVTTGNEEEKAELRCLESGASDFLKKPYSAELVRHRVKSLLRLWDNAALIHRLETDQLTGLLSKESFYRHTQELLDANPDTQFYMLYTDIDDFKMINARYGTAVGDELLKFLAALFQTYIKKGEICGRVGPDNFAMLLHDIPDYTQQEAGKISAADLKNAPVKGVQLKTGIYPVTGRELPVSDMCDRAKLAVSSVKHRYGLYYAVYDDTLRQTALREHQLANTMEEALEKHQFAVYFQPKHCTESGAVSGAEALVRWNHPELGFIPPKDFIPLFERNGFIARLDRYILQEVCQRVKSWIGSDITPIPISVNISRADFIADDLPEQIMQIVDSYELPHELIHLEITESAYTDRPQQIIAAVTALRDLGFLIEMDDFGSGYSSLNMLSELPIDILKLDMRFIQSGDMRMKGNKHNILSFILSLSKWLHFPTVAEGVETQEEFELLKSMGCNLVQGYYFAKPMPAAEFESYMRACAQSCQLPKLIRKEDELWSSPTEVEKPLVLVAEDVESNREVMRELLKPYYRVAIAENGKQACEFLARHSQELSCILLDLLMPVMDGFQVLEVMRANDLIHEIPVIITTETGSDSELRALHLGADSFVAKPYNSEILLHHVNKAVQEKAFWKTKREFELEKQTFLAEKKQLSAEKTEAVR